MYKYSEFDFIIGVDVGVHTGICFYSQKHKSIADLRTWKIHEAILTILDWFRAGKKILVRVEDARLRKWFGNNAREKMQGAGSIKRDSQIWEDFLQDWEIPFELVHPKDNKTKLAKAAFKKITGWDGRTSVHARDAAMLCWGL